MTEPGLFDAFEAQAADAPHRLLLASAGTGKTYQLANHFAGLLLLGIEPQRILATTFTRKAAGEILDRVLMRLHEAAGEDARGKEARKALLEAVHRFDPHRGAIAAAECLEVVARLVRKIDRFQVRTLDAFFVRLARLFAMELEIAPEWRITDEVEETALVAEGVARVLEQLDTAERLELLRGMTRGAASREAQSKLVSTVEEADAIARAAEDGAWRALEPLAPVSRDEVAAAFTLLESFDVPRTKKGQGPPIKNWEKAVDELRAIDGPDAVTLDVLDNGLVKKVAAGEAKYSSADIPDEFAAALRTIVARATEREIESIILRNLATESFLTQYAAADVVLRAERGAYRFTDFPRALEQGPARAGRSEWSAELGYRLDAKIDHLLLDEFQDTAPNQWRLLLPLADEVLGDGTGERSFFCVGDVKQSIYGWRGGEPRLLSRMAERHPVLEVEPLTVSYRSSGVVLDVVNRVFGGLAARATFREPEREAALAAAEEWSASFAPHSTARTEMAGEARLWQVRPADKAARETAMEPAIRACVGRVKELYGERPGASIAVLVRSRAEIPRLRFLLGEEGIEASDEGGNPLTDSVGVTWIVALLHLADHPADGIAALQVARSPFASKYGLAPETVGSDAAKIAASRAAACVREQLLREGYGAFCEQHAELLLAGASAWDTRRLEQLVDIALAHDGRAGLRPVDFADFVRTQRVADPAASRVKVMTIHASKGLEFDVVVLPELGRDIRLTPGDFLVDRPSELSRPELATARPKKSIAMQHSTLRRLYESEQQRGMIDALSGLYVGLTRAVHCVEMIVTAPAATKVPLSHGAIVGEALGATLVGDWAGESEPVLVWEHEDSSASWARELSLQGAPEPVEERSFELRPGSSAGAAPRVQRPSASGRAAERAVGAAALLAAPAREAARVGTLVHALFEGFTWLDDEDRSVEELTATLARIAPDAPDLVRTAVARFRAALAAPGLASLFKRPEGGARVLPERTFDVEISDTDGDPYRWRGAIDRLVLTLEGGRVTRASIVDFKTDAATSGDEVAAAHARQMEAYREAVVALFGLDEAAVDCTIAWLGGEGGGAALTI